MIALLLLICLIGMAPAVLLIADGPLTLGIECGVLAIALAVLARTLSWSDATLLRSLLRPVAVLAVVPVIIMVVQVMPLPAVLGLADPIWQSVANALGRPITGSISVDTGSTVLSLCAYLAWLGVGLLSTAVSIARSRADWVLFAATSATVIIGALLILNDAGVFVWLGGAYHQVTRGAALDASEVGLLLSATCAMRACERFKIGRGDDARLMQRLIFGLASSGPALLICAIAIALEGSENNLFAASAGLVTILGLALLRSLGFGPVAGLAVAITACTLAEWIVAGRIASSDSDFTLRFAVQSPLISTAAAMLADSTWTGTGAGTYHDLVPIYRQFTGGLIEFAPPTAAAKIAVEWGRPLLWSGVVAVFALIVLLLWAALRRTRDSFYPAAGAGLLVSLLLSAFSNAGLFSSAIMILSGAVIGLALAQRRGRPS